MSESEQPFSVRAQDETTVDAATPRIRRISVPLTDAVMGAGIIHRVWSSGSDGTVTIGVRHHAVTVSVEEARAVLLDLDCAIRQAERDE